MDFSESRPDQVEYSEVDAAENEYFREKPDGSVNPAAEAGWFLQRERERLGLTLEEAGESTGIHPYHLEAFEIGDLTRMPNRADALNMVGYYAHFLGFDAEPLIHHYATILPKPQSASGKAHPANPGPLSSALILKFGSFPKLPKFDINLGSFPGGAGGAAASFLVAIMVFAGASWLMLDTGPITPAQQTAEVVAPVTPPATPQIMAEQAMPDAAPQGQQQAIAIPEATQPEQLDGMTALIEQTIPDEGAGTPGKPVATQDVTASIEPGQAAPDKPAAGGGEQTSRLTLRAKGPVWVRIEDAAGNVVMTQMLMAGDTYQVPNREGLVVIARDGGLLAYMIDGKEKGILGPPGEILVGRSLDLKGLEQPS